MKIRPPSPLLAQTQRGDPIRTVNADIAAAELDPDSEESRALYKKPGVRLTLPPTQDGPQNRPPIELADFFGERIAAEQLAKDPDARVAAELLNRRDETLDIGERQRTREEQRKQRAGRYGRRG
ncbi:MAG: hypothetical protein GTN84_17390 [Hydrogenophaga sp.]|uniref:hypothetical protein n=1 Tax=Hydrogenophaga sp. TaxID=1904254 RepID=UPI00169C30A9|nr:hypothetical protein [Hydrogenophaga sp.]NIM43018.1 hypothetical protein [Hydrogenophaga sp.]NIN28086.1 hypothetical protein [Hydrogenophaga sp.]NIN30524.1 hypothetical protein [Hydrogenophaga sp.]NIN57221.1 hypothetical protein [Hydrogenophaga sp.]NIO51440.1 hypothetical protein [Hydrogenophaga sp.]